MICNSYESEPFLLVTNRFNPEEKFSLVQCETCGFVFLNPRPQTNSLHLFYQYDRYQPHQLDTRSFFDKLYTIARVWNNRYKRYIIERYVQHGQLLDFGCGSGDFLLSVKKAGWQVFGVEQASTPRRYANDLGLNVQKKIDDFNGEFDVITLWHVLEHISDVHRLIEEIKKRLSRTGFLIVAVPNLSSYDSQKYGSNWIAYDAPRHLFHFRPADIYQLMTVTHGMNMVDLKTLYLDTWFNTLLSWRLEIESAGKKTVAGILKLGMVGLFSTIKETINRLYSSSIVYIFKNSEL